MNSDVREMLAKLADEAWYLGQRKLPPEGAVVLIRCGNSLEAVTCGVSAPEAHMMLATAGAFLILNPDSIKVFDPKNPSAELLGGIVKSEQGNG